MRSVHNQSDQGSGRAGGGQFDLGRRQRFEEIYAIVYEPLQRYLRRRASIDDADEVLDDVLLVLWQRLPTLAVDDCLPWCYGVARRALANRRRSMARRQGLLERLGAQPVQVPIDEVGLDDYPALASAFRLLAESDREVLRLWAWEGLEPREIATVLGTSANAVSLRLTKAKKKLTGLLAGQNPDDAGHKERENTGEHQS
ncbi:MAG: sigma-70 family RNA polymerase sigma factor [Acidimicrobiia bacterium]|nr:sigma-70 family RNA polymerase sigma factor [Acidimicrobiia bacterium]